MHQMSINGKRGAFVVGDLLALAMSAGIKARLAKGIISEVTEAVSNWASFAVEADVAKNAVIKIKRTHRRLDIS
jgi:serine/threonine-protein kinase HipA